KVIGHYLNIKHYQ
ncbi:hypothetical protein KAF69_19545, partial [Klebsiella pneumoniae]|nr:hypothetical protein [Klebsiella pneumoniae]